MSGELTAEAMAVLPATDEALRCADFARDLAVDPGGTAIAADLLVLIDTPTPWPKPVFAHEHLTGLAGTFDTAVGRAKLLATQPTSEEAGQVLTYWRQGRNVIGSVHWAPTADELSRLIEQIRNGGPMASAFMTDEPAPGRALLVCTQGSHDVCCGSDGTRFANEATTDHPELEVLRVSHTGGHRFAPTAMTLPDGRMWGYLDAAALDVVVERRADPEEVADRCRGWWGAAPGFEQFAEREIFAISEWDWERTDRTTAIVERSDDHCVVAVTADEDERWLVTVEIGRDIPTIACRVPGGLPAKPGREYAVLDIQLDG